MNEDYALGVLSDALPKEVTQISALSQILVCGRYAVSSPLAGYPLRGQGVELFGRTAALLTPPFKLPLAQHVHELNAG